MGGLTTEVTFGLRCKCSAGQEFGGSWEELGETPVGGILSWGPSKEGLPEKLVLTRVTGTIENSNVKDQNQGGLADLITSNTCLDWIKGW